MIEPDESRASQPEWLHALDKASDLFLEGGKSHVPGMFHALRVAAHRLEIAGANEKQLKPLRALMIDLDRVNHGQAPKLITLRRGTPPDSSDGANSVHQGVALAVQELIFRSLGGKRGSRGIAQRKAAVLLTKYGFRTRVGHAFTENVLRQLRVDVIAEKASVAGASQIYEDLISRYPGEFPTREGLLQAEALAAHIAAQPGF